MVEVVVEAMIGGDRHSHLAFSSSSPLARRGRFGLKAVRQNRANKPFVNANALQLGGRFVSDQAAFSWRPTVGIALTQRCNSSGVMIVALPSLWAISSPPPGPRRHFSGFGRRIADTLKTAAGYVVLNRTHAPPPFGGAVPPTVVLNGIGASSKAHTKSHLETCAPPRCGAHRCTGQPMILRPWRVPPG